MTDQTKPKKAPVAEPLLPKAWEVPQEFRDRMGDDAGRQRVMQADGHLLLVLHAPPAPGQSIRFGKTYWRSPERVWKPVALNHNQHPIGELIDQYEQAIDALDHSEEEALAAKDYFAVLTALNPLLRSCHNLYEVLRAARKAEPIDRDLLLLRDRAYALNRRAELLQQDTKNMLDFVIARRAEQQADSARAQARAAHRLNVLAALFFPVLTSASLLSTGLDHGIPLLEQADAPLPFLIVLGGGLALGALLAAFITRE